MEGTRIRGWPHKWWSDEDEEDLKYSGNKKQAGSGQRLSGTEKDCTGSQGAGRGGEEEEEEKYEEG